MPFLCSTRLLQVSSAAAWENLAPLVWCLLPLTSHVMLERMDRELLRHLPALTSCGVGSLDSTACPGHRLREVHFLQTSWPQGRSSFLSASLAEGTLRRLVTMLVFAVPHQWTLVSARSTISPGQPLRGSSFTGSTEGRFCTSTLVPPAVASASLRETREDLPGDSQVRVPPSLGASYSCVTPAPCT